MANINTATIFGRLTKDPELKTTQSGKNVASVTLAVNGFKEDDTSFIDVVFWNKTAEVLCDYVTKGQMVGVTGRLQQRKFEDKQGNSRSVVEIVANELQLPPKTNNTHTEVVLEDISEEPIDLSELDVPF